MTLLAVLFILFGLTGYGLKEYYQIKLGKPVSTPPAVIAELTDFLNQYAPNGRFIDLGSGWGKTVLTLAKNLPDWQIDGVEASPTPWFIANCRSIGRNTNNFRFFIGRMERHNLQSYDVIFCHQPTRHLATLLPRLGRALQSDSFVLTYPNPLPRLPNPDILLTDSNERLYLYRGTDALAFLNPPEPAQTAPEVQPEPAQEPTPIPADQSEPTPDNDFEQLPDDTAPPAETTQPIEPPAQPAQPSDLPPATDYPEQARLPLNYTD